MIHIFQRKVRKADYAMADKKNRQNRLHISIVLYILFCMGTSLQAQPTPGGVKGDFAVWLTAERYGNGIWLNEIPNSAVGNFQSINQKGGTAVLVPPAKINTGYNFHPSVQFTKSGGSGSASDQSRLVSQASFNVANKNVTIFIVYKRNFNTAWENLFSFNGNNDGNIGWYNTGNHGIRWYWQNSDVALVTAQEGIITLDNANSASNGLNAYLDGNAVLTGQTKGVRSYNSQLAIATNGSSGYGFDGNIQEIIVVSAGASGQNMNATNLLKIHSYLAVKYGVHLTANHYLNSKADTVWNRKLNPQFNNNIFGIGRDDDGGLYQRQSQSRNSDALILFIGKRLETLNSQNTGVLSDGQYVMIGGNSKDGNKSYNYSEGYDFDNGTLINKMNYRTSMMYFAQVTQNGIADDMTVNMQVKRSTARYVLVCPDTNFNPSNTRAYPLRNQIAMNVLLNHGDYISIGGFEPTPGGTLNTTYAAWLTPESYSNGTWNNLIGNASSIGNFSGAKVSPAVSNTNGYNFHPAVLFNKPSNDRGQANNQLTSQLPINIQNSNNIISIFVFKRTAADYWDYLIGFGGADNYNTLNWRSTNHTIDYRWAGSGTTIPNVQEGLFVLSNPNIARSGSNLADATRVYQNGVRKNVQSWQWDGSTYKGSGKVTIGGSRNDAALWGYRGQIQEVILIKQNNALYNGHLEETDLQKIHSYLGIKYGITIDASVGNYLASDSSTVWDRTANKGYNNHIIGIARDDNSGLYQKQTRSTTFRYLTVFLGSNIATLNSQNNGSLEDRQYLMIGTNSSTPVNQASAAQFPQGTVYVNGDSLAIDLPVNIQSGIFKTQLTNMDSIRINMQSPTSDFSYILLSKTEAFDANETKIYPVRNRLVDVVIDTAFKYFVFIGTSPGPAGVVKGLNLWLRADDDASLNITERGIGEDGLRTGNSAVRNTSYPNKYGLETNGIPTVDAWRDLARGHNYLALPDIQNSAPGQSGERYPVFHQSRSEMNFHPAVEFWSRTADYSNNASGSPSGNDQNASAFLGNRSPLFSTPTVPKHLLIMITNNDFNTNPWVFPFGFNSFTAKDNTWRGPAYGMERSKSNNVDVIGGRFRIQENNNGGILTGKKSLFEPGSTSILMFDNNSTSTTNHLMTFRFNGQRDVVNNSVSLTMREMNTPTKLGSPFFACDRTIEGFMSEVIFYDAAQLDDDEKDRIESYLALKYGVTLYPNGANSSSVFGRFNYRFSNDAPIWSGDYDFSDPVNGKFAKFYNRVAAVIRDDASRLNNRQSHSTNTGSLLRLGVAGTAMTDKGEYLGSMARDLEAVAFGDNDRTGFFRLKVDDCGAYDTVFRRIWLVHKTSADPVQLIVAAEYNKDLTIGRDTLTYPYYDKLTAGFDVFMLIADSARDLEEATFNPKAVIPMTYLDKMHQCNYVFSEECTYITFACKRNGKGCNVGNMEMAFNGLRTFDWTNHTANQNRSSRAVPRVPNQGFVRTNVGSNIEVQSFVTFGRDIRAGYGFPRSVNSPEKGSLQVRRTRGTIRDVVTVNMQFRSAIDTSIKFHVIPSFTISGIDGIWYNYDSVCISGLCETEYYLPRLTPEGATDKMLYRINNQAASATALKPNFLYANNLNGTVNVAFEGGVTDVTIKYFLRNRVNATQNIFISPVNLRAVLPPPPFDEAGISFVQTAIPPQVSVCKEVTYTYQIQNANCNPKKVNFSAVLPAGMIWQNLSLALDSDYMDNMTVIHNYGDLRTLQIDSLIIPAASTARFNAVAYFEETAQAGLYTNKAVLEYEQIVQDIPRRVKRESCDGLTMGCQPTTVKALDGVILKKMEVERFQIDKPCYTAGDTLTVTLQVRNPNAVKLHDAALELFFNEEFQYVRNSFASNINNDSSVELSHEFDTLEVIPVQGGNLVIDTGNAGSLLFLAYPVSNGLHTISFKVVAPNTLRQDFEDTTPKFDESHTPLFVDFGVAFSLFSLSDEECAATVFYNAYGEAVIPAIPVVGITGNKDICMGSTSQLSRWQGGRWTSSDATVATVNSITGKITAVGEGKAVFYFQPDGSNCQAVSKDTLRVYHSQQLFSDTLFEICSGSLFAYTPSGSASGTVFNWSRPSMPEINEPANLNQTGNISEVLTNNTSNSVDVAYIIEIAANGCTSTQNVRVTVNPRQTPTIMIRRKK